MKRPFLLLPLLLFIRISLFASDIDKNYSHFLDSVAESIPALNQQVDISVSDISLKELIRILGNSTGLNVSADPGINSTVNSNFNGVQAKDVISFLCSNFNLIPEVYGNILYLKPVRDDGKKLSIGFIPGDSILSYQVSNTPAEEFFRELTRKTNVNFVLNPGITGTPIRGFAQNISFSDAITQIASSNNLDIQEKNPSLFIVNLPLKANAEKTTRSAIKPVSLQYSNGLISVQASDCPISDLLKNLEAKSDYSCCFLSPVQEKVSLNIKDYDLNHFLSYIFSGSEETYRIDDHCIFVGNRKLAEIKTCEMIRLNNRRVDSLKVILPAEYKKNLEINEFLEQNSFIIWGDADKIYQFKKIIRDIDIPVPVILIDVIIIDSSKSFGVESGLEAGIGEEPTTTSGTINEGLNLTLGAGSVNNLMKHIGLANLGKVTPNFYLKLKAMETDGIIDIRSTPQLSTLNGHSASLSIGETEYYKEESTTIYGTQDPQLLTQATYKPVEAKLQVDIKPFVTGNGQVSLDISVIKSEFTERLNDEGPPGTVSREFKSKISVRNQDMILLGGLEENTSSVSSSGWPLLSRIPVLKWFFSSRSDTKKKNHLNIFIKPTVFY